VSYKYVLNYILMILIAKKLKLGLLTDYTIDIKVVWSFT